MLTVAIYTKATLSQALRDALAGQNLRLHFARTVEEACDLVRDADVAILPQSKMDRAMGEALAANRRLRLLQLASSGHDRLPGLPFPPQAQLAGSSDALAPYVAEHALGLLMTLLMRRAVEGWPERLRHKRVTIIGTGAIGQRIARQLTRHGVKIVGVSRRGLAQRYFDHVYPVEQTLVALADAEVLMLAAPENPRTTGLIDSIALGELSRGAYLINVARGALVRTDALARALQTGRLAAAGLDVTDPNPLPPDHVLRSMPNVLITPHCAGAAAEGDVANHIARNIERLRHNMQLQNPILFRVEPSGLVLT